MFQNISKEYEDVQYDNNDVKEKKDRSKIILKDLFKKQNIIMYLISFMISTVGFGQDMPIFSMVILAVACSNNIPIGIIYILTCIGTGIGFGKDILLMYILTSLIFMAVISIFKHKVDEVNESKKLGKHLCIAVGIVQLGKLVFNNFLVYDLLVAITYIILTGIFYKIFTNSIKVIKELGVKKAFSIEEVLGASLLIAIAVAGFKDLAIYNYSLKNILSILIVLILGWQNGILVGATSGITIGLVLGIIGNGDITQIASYAISGMIAGLFNKLGKVGVIVGFILGNIVLTYVAKGNNIPIIMIQEILIASIGLLAVPKNIKINIEDLFGKTKYLPVNAEKKIEQSQDAIYKLNDVSEVISEVAQTYKEVAATVDEIEEDKVNKNYKIFVEELQNNLLGLEENILYEELTEEDSEIVEELFKELINNDEVNKKSLIKILEENNNYIVGFDDDNSNSDLNRDINDIVRAINYSYRISKIDFIWKKKVEKTKETMGIQLDDISKAINTIAGNINRTVSENKIQEEEIKEILKQKNIETNDIKIKKEKSGKLKIDVYTDICNSEKIEECKCEKIKKILSKNLNDNIVLINEECNRNSNFEICNLKYISDDKYNIQIGIARKTKDNSPVSGDNILDIKLKDGKHLLTISDGMGSGPNAKKSSTIATKMLKRLLMSGFDKETSIELINSSLCLNSEDETYATLDVAVLDLYNGNIEFIKNGACPTYIKNKKNVDIINTISLPTGILENLDLDVFDRDIGDNDIIVMCSDGIIESNTEYENKELWVKYLIEEIETDNVQRIADIILKESIDNEIGNVKDDMTVIVAKITTK